MNCINTESLKVPAGLKRIKIIGGYLEPYAAPFTNRLNQLMKFKLTLSFFNTNKESNLKIDI